jgi:hypothetical protein
MENQNSQDVLDKNLIQLLEQLRDVYPVSVERFDRPPDHPSADLMQVDTDTLNPDARHHVSELDRRIMKDNELYDDDDAIKEGDGKDRTNYGDAVKKETATTQTAPKEAAGQTVVSEKPDMMQLDPQ